MKHLLDKVIETGAQSGEIYYRSSKKRSIKFDNNILKGANFNQSTGIALSLIKDGRIVSSTATDINSFPQLIKNCEEMSTFSPKAEFDFINKPNNNGVVIPQNDIESLSDEKLIEDGNRIVSEITKEFSDVKVGVDFEINSSEVEICNTKGLSSKFNMSSLSFSAVGSFIKENNFIYAYEQNKLITKDYDVDAMIKSLKESIALSRNLVKFESGKKPVIFTPRFLGCALLPLVLGISGKQVSEGSSPLKDKVNQCLFDERFTIIDNGTKIGGINTRPFDDEGTPTQVTEIIKDGYLKNFIHTVKTATKLNMEPTGNGYKVGSFMPDFNIALEATPYISNFEIKAGDVLFNDMIKGIKDGLIIDSVIGFFMGNIMNGEITGTIGDGYHIKDGKVVGRTSGQSINFNIYDIFKNNLVDISSDTKNEPFIFGYGCNPTPYAMFKDINIE